MFPASLYVDIHSHHPPGNPEVLTLYSLYEHFAAAGQWQACSLGLHPWYLHHIPEQMAELEQYACLPQVKAVGECGLDKVCATPWPLQEEAFRMQIDLANRLQKPLIIHCVKAYTEVLQLLKAAKVPAVFHGFRKNEKLAAVILDQGHYLSFGAALVKEDKNALASLERVSSGRFFLETDDSEVSIQRIYRAAAGIRKTGEDALILQLQQNYKKVFAI